MTVLLGMVLGVAIGAAVVWGRRPPSPPPVDNTALVADVLSRAVAQTAEAIGKAVSASQFAPPEPPRPPSQKVMRFDPDIEAGLVDASDPTDGQGWLNPDRPMVAFLSDSDFENLRQGQ